MKSEIADQAIVFHGQSGSGKSESMKMVIECLVNSNLKQTLQGATDLELSSEASLGPLGFPENPFLDIKSSNPQISNVFNALFVMSSLGNARTVRNMNSSRHSMEHSLVFNEEGKFLGSIMCPSILERSRVSLVPENEHNFHVFYQLLLGATPRDQELWKLKEVSDYKYLNGTNGNNGDENNGNNSNGREPGKDREAFKCLRRGLKALGVDVKTQAAFFKLLSGVLLLGNISFIGEDATVENVAVVEECAELMGVSADGLESGLTSKVVLVAGEKAMVPLSCEEAYRVTDSLAQEIYARSVDWIICKVNEFTLATVNTDKTLTIKLVDVGGFENNSDNSFEQLRMNYASETIHQLFLREVFHCEQELAASEGIAFPSLQLVDNQHVLSLISGTTSVFAQLNEACLYSKSTDDKFLLSLHSTLKRSQGYQRPIGRVAMRCFGVKHSCGLVQYTAKNFLVKNSTRVSPLAIRALMGSNEILNDLFTETECKDGLADLHTSLLRRDMHALVDELRPFEPNFILCVNPNDKCESCAVEQQSTIRQIRSLCIAQIIHLHSESFAERIPYEEFYERFSLCAPHQTLLKPQRNNNDESENGSILREASQELLWGLLRAVGARRNAIQQINASIQFGKTLIFAKSMAWQVIEAIREKQLRSMTHIATVFQSVWRSYCVRKRIKKLDHAVLSLQRTFRAGICREKRAHQLLCFRRLQLGVRAWLTRKWFIRVKVAAIVIQVWFKRQRQRLEWIRQRRGLARLHLLANGFYAREQLMKKVRGVLLLQRVSREFLRKNRAYKDTMYRATIIQSYWRGYHTRTTLPDVQRQLCVLRDLRHRNRASTFIQNAFKGSLLRRRLYELKTAALILQQWFRSRGHRFRFLHTMWATVTIQRMFRGVLQRKAYNNIRTAGMVAEKSWKLAASVDKEAASVKLRSYDDIANDSVMQLTDVDVLTDTSLMYSSGWVQPLMDLEDRLQPNDISIKQVACGSAHSLILDSEGSLYSYGWNETGQLGQYESLGSAVAPVEIEFADVVPSPKFISIACGANHSIALTSKGQIYTWGSNSNGQLGVGDTKTRYSPMLVTMKERVTQISAGAKHCLALTRSGAVWSWGSGNMVGHGVHCGNGNTLSPQPIRGLIRSRIQHIYTGWHFSVALGYSGEVFSWGLNKHGELGHGDLKNRKVPMRVSGLLPVDKMDCGARHCVCVTKNGRVYAWGWNSEGQLGTGDENDRNVPTPVPGVCGSDLAGVSCGWRGSMIRTTDGLLSGWGHIKLQGGCRKSSVALPLGINVAPLHPIDLKFSFSDTMSIGYALCSSQDIHFEETSALLKDIQRASPKRRSTRARTHNSSTTSTTPLGSSSRKNRLSSNSQASVSMLSINVNHVPSCVNNESSDDGNTTNSSSSSNEVEDAGKHIQALAVQDLETMNVNEMRDLLKSLRKQVHTASPRRQNKSRSSSHLSNASSSSLSSPTKRPLIPLLATEQSNRSALLKLQKNSNEERSSTKLYTLPEWKDPDKMAKERAALKKQEQLERIRWRESREKTAKMQIMTLFSSPLLVSCSNPDVQLQDVLSRYGYTSSNSLTTTDGNRNGFDKFDQKWEHANLSIASLRERKPKALQIATRPKSKIITPPNELLHDENDENRYTPPKSKKPQPPSVLPPTPARMHSSTALSQFNAENSTVKPNDISPNALDFDDTTTNVNENGLNDIGALESEIEQLRRQLDEQRSRNSRLEVTRVALAKSDNDDAIDMLGDLADVLAQIKKRADEDVASVWNGQCDALVANAVEVLGSDNDNTLYDGDIMSPSTAPTPRSKKQKKTNSKKLLPMPSSPTLVSSTTITPVIPTPTRKTQSIKKKKRTNNSSRKRVPMPPPTPPVMKAASQLPRNSPVPPSMPPPATARSLPTEQTPVKMSRSRSRTRRTNPVPPPTPPTTSQVHKFPSHIPSSLRKQQHSPLDSNNDKSPVGSEDFPFPTIDEMEVPMMVDLEGRNRKQSTNDLFKFVQKFHLDEDVEASIPSLTELINRRDSTVSLQSQLGEH
eukprot:TRINITY_DN99_c0_g1_i1.p1 TRINITY_DN99_c0_g1~~TRINITY_DN99_c0_g1_i1.p1  ORF type:complete len:2201 (+),score=714.06 TRINITY_DN99_c0_g1_i1:545-6604(+)